MQNMSSSIGAELEKDRCKAMEIRELNDGPVLNLSRKRQNVNVISI